MNLITAKQELLDSKARLSLKWQKVEEVWQDAQAEHFKKTYIERLEREFKVSLEAIDEIGTMFKQIEAECFK